MGQAPWQKPLGVVGSGLNVAVWGFRAVGSGLNVAVWGFRGCDRGKVHALKNKLRQARETAPLFNTEQFTRNLEDLYQQIISEKQGQGTAR